MDKPRFASSLLALASSGSAPQAPPLERLRTERLRLLAPRIEQARAVADYLARNRAHFAPWDPPAGPEVSTVAFQRSALRDAAQAFGDGSAYRFWLCRHEDMDGHHAERASAAPQRIVGSVHFTNIARGAFHSATLGYSLDVDVVGSGLMTEALRCAIAAMFSPAVNLHRIQASWRPNNLRSGAVLERLGFHDEGMARDYLYIDGAWRDHRIFALLNPGFVVPAGWPVAR
jgi:ribosomal-protein-alanine N-acetyltransferase